MTLPTIIAGNWKMYHTQSTGTKMLQALHEKLSGHLPEIIIFPPAINIDSAMQVTKNSPIQIGAQNLYSKAEGAFTGEISGPMIKELGCSHVLIGHSERRQYFNETNADTQLKIQAALENSLIPILCVGETLAQRENNETEAIISSQIAEALAGLPTESIFIIAYEPVWAIGTGKVASIEQAQAVHHFIRNLLKKLGFNAEMIPILYGGSVKPDNASDLLAQPDINGALVGGASLDADSFYKIIQAKNLVTGDTHVK